MVISQPYFVFAIGKPYNLAITIFAKNNATQKIPSISVLKMMLGLFRNRSINIY